MANCTERERSRSAYLSGDRFGYIEARVTIRDTRTWAARWQRTVETAKSLECNLTMQQQTVAYNLGRLRALFLELALAEDKSNATARIRWQGHVETVKSLRCDLATPPETVTHNFGQVRALLLDLTPAEGKSSALPQSD